MVDDVGARLKFNGFNATFCQAQCIAGRPGPANSGANGQSFWLYNTAFGDANFEHIWDSGNQHVLGFHMDWRMLTQTGDKQSVPINHTDVEWLRISTPTTVLMALETFASGNMRIRGEGGTIIAVTDNEFYYDTWYSLEAKWGFGAGNGWEFRVNGVVVAHAASPISNKLPDRMSIRFQGFGPPGINVDNMVFWDGRNDDHLGFNDFLGPCRITTLWPTTDLNNGWVPTPGPTRSAMLSDLPFAVGGDHPPDASGSPDGDPSYVAGSGSPLLLNVSQLYSRLYSPCFGRNLAVALNAVCRPLVTGQAVQYIVQPLSMLHVLANVGVTQFPGTGYTLGQRPALNNYANYQIIVPNNPEGNVVWTDSVIQSAAWGFGAGSTGQFRATQMNLEKLTSLLPLSYGCGGGNYVYTV